MKSFSITKNKQTKEDAERQARLKKEGEIPSHIAIIMDGNGRWAKRKGNARARGHQAGVESVRDITESCAQLGVGYLTLYTFSTENWKRPNREVNALMKLLVSTLRKEAKKLDDNDIQLASIGDVSRFPKVCREELDEAIKLTRDNTRMRLCLALSYSGRWDLTRAVRHISEKVKNGELDPDQIDEEVVDNHLSTADMPDPGLIIRTGGEYRVSNFLLWQQAYSEWFITDTLWPDFRRNHLYEAISWFHSRDRRFGKLSEQNEDSNKSWTQKVFSQS